MATNDKSVSFIDGWEESMSGVRKGMVTMNRILDRKHFEEGWETVTVGYRVYAWSGIEGGVSKYFYFYIDAQDEYDRLVSIFRNQRDRAA